MSAFRIQVWEPGEPLPEKVIELAYQVLYEPLGQPWDGPWSPRVRETDSYRIALYDESDQVVGHARVEPGTCIVKTVAVSPASQGRGVGRALMNHIEGMCRSWGAAEVVFDARVTAVGFYKKLGYEVTGEEFVRQPSGLPHFPMRKPLK